ncbi:hypothetical protein IEN85_04760 [Pelagicoccus sp. NFK12]|uniref:Uncharacterized protein n=1 Tax=Pelagicoccus enzymogenes TaxID=2773457 RepID=A0A927F7R8_9BACT|nr:hypothetical protein [Pelagicoccus enzymogenes]MBD5778791.1 hypothetical protein [Pelagicoccus enzymogenes]
MKKIIILILVGLGGCVFYGCKHGNAVTFATSTQLGVKVGTNAQSVPEINIGYARQEGAKVPVYWEQKETEDNFSASQPTTNAILRQVLLSIENGDDAQSLDLMEQVLEVGKRDDGKSLVLLEQIKKVLTPSAGGVLTAQNRSTAKSLISAEMSKAASFKEFYEDGKFAGTFEMSESGYVISDSLSVMGTFAGSGKGKSKGGDEGSSSISQYFVTGAAAQILAWKGGAASVNPAAETPSELNEEKVFAEGFKEGEQIVTLSSELSGWIYDQDSDSDGSIDIGEKLSALKTLRGPDAKPSDAQLGLGAGKNNKAELEIWLQGLGRDILGKWKKRMETF